MLTHLSLRLRIFLFFCLLALGAIAVSLGSLWLSYQRAATPALLDPFVFAGLMGTFAILGLCAGIWLLFDENVAKPIEVLAAEMRLRAHGGVSRGIDAKTARYLGDLAPAAAGLAGQLGDSTLLTARNIAEETARLEADKRQLTTLLSELPVATVMLGSDHHIVLYDAQAADVLAQIAHPRLNASMFDYLDRVALQAAYEQMNKTGKEVQAQVCGRDEVQSYSVSLKPLGQGEGYVLIFDAAVARIAPDAARPLIYDFALLERPLLDIADRPLKDLCFAVFDTETTGLLPHKDEIVQIGAVRVLNGRMIEGEQFDTLVDPQRPIPEASTRVHGVSNAMVQGAPVITKAAAQFHLFAKDAVIVAHNAPFDMAFLRRHAKATGVKWDHPILDTVLLSAVLFGSSVPHTLDALCERLDITIPPALRHTALGDAHATANALVQMIPMLQARGFDSLAQVIEQTRRHGRLLEDLNPVDNHGGTWQAGQKT
ncbi:3'-5' exonuclease [Phaeobacter sp. 11ANDIMAR09]|uniref:3'-5' exonuclease n=1 Tax=Phaeobacter sp. 11ANDIMAR09 TaxID=1225647 RepID=UPI0006C8A804|nr:3'-5' exonuclease [Phaeobacter sp. 11ANDIMAR09]KPD11347.1 3'-5' exonuclease [Phaeobacter sp. 11ANDIMAR09]